MPGRKIAIVGTAPSSRDLAPYGDPNWEIWGISPFNYDLMKRWDMWFELHDDKLYKEQGMDPGFWQWMQQQEKPIYLQKVHKDIPASVKFPKDKLLKEFSMAADRNFFQSSISWMIAFAIMEGAEEIGVWGVDMARDTEYAEEKPSCTYFLGIAEGRGIKVTLPVESDLMHSVGLYGYDDTSAIKSGLRSRDQELEQRINGCEQIIRDKQNEVFYLKGARDDIKYMMNNWCV